MSGICGYWDLSGAALRPDPLAPVMDRLRRRGPDGSHAWQEGPVALGHCNLATTPEALYEVLPLTHSDTGCTITADARLDNRAELLTALGAGPEARSPGDGELILRAYLRWGEDCVDHLLGDFAFAIRDPRRQAIFCARDRMAMRQLIYTHRPGALFAFATDARALVTLPDVPARVNEARVLDFIDCEIEGVDGEVTFFEGVLRLPAAHSMTVDARGLRLRRYWRLEPEERLCLPSDAAYAEAFTEVFTEAVRCRLRSPETPGAMLSGGMDSGSVAAVAADLLAAQGRGPLPTFSGTGPDPARVETRLIDDAMGLPGIAPTAIRCDRLGPLLPALRARIDDLDDPFDGNMTIIAAVYMTAAQAGVKVVLDGVSGDTAFARGNVLEAAIRDGRWRDILRFARGEARAKRRQKDFWWILLRAAWGRVVPAGLRQRRHAWLTEQSERRHISRSLAAPELLVKHDFAGRRARYRARNYPEGLALAAERASRMTADYVMAGAERYDRVAAAQGVESRDPYRDMRVLKFCLSLPDSQIWRNGYAKFILRSAMDGRLPDSIRWNRVRDHHGWDFTRAVFTSAPDLLPGTFPGTETAQRFLRPGTIPHKCVLDNATDLEIWSEIVFLQSWLEVYGA
ncbi:MULTISPECIES: asparagine synthase-related protein [unclassified Mameliella]|uniref:asparagine synthase-related protein n=1 Tax=unclassified Mameliella TaxID=2630630 RepID=UPI00273D2EC3|nr:MULTISPECIES: asparagine synthase-related protein [unclassified Mameliella]